jgi:TetR/AcrR family transcriptional regulator, cholesterol catabolism regulator
MEIKGNVETYHRIQEQAKTLFMKYGMRSVSMDDIAGELGMSKKTIYQYFADKDELVDAVVNQDIRDMQSDCNFCFNEAADAIEEIFLTMDRILGHFRDLNPMLLYDLQKFHFNSYKKFKENKDTFLLEIIRKNIQRGIDEGLYRPDLDVEILSRYRLESMMVPFNIDMFPPSRFNLADVTLVIIEHFVFGLTTLKGYNLILQYQQERTKKKKDDNRQDY